MSVVVVGTGNADFRNELKNSVEGYIAQAGSRAKGVSFN
jgi:hypothetical protein